MKKNQMLLMGVAIHLMTAIGTGFSTSPAMAATATTRPAQRSALSPLKSPNDSIVWINDTLSINEAAVIAHFGNAKKSPLRLTTLSNETIRQRAVAKSYPEMLKEIPGLYATSESGSFGDAKVNVRGFKQENISVLLNGIPISGQTSGSMYWNNWMGLSDATYAIQVQKGVGSSMLSDNSVGGTINIITTPATEDFYLEAGAYGTHFGSGKGYLNVNSGILPKGWSINFMASYLGGKGYVDQTDVSTFSYMLNINKTFGLHHSLTFTALGSPERHGQRNTRLTKAEVDKHGLHYNKNWGMLEGKPYNLSQNKYFKPYFTLQHRFSKGKWSAQNSIYLAIAHGGGRWNESKGARMSSILGKDGLIDFERILNENRNSTEGSKYILSDFMAGHLQVGAILSGALRVKGWTLETGLHYQHYSTWEKEKITDLLGGGWWWEDSHKGDAPDTDHRKKVGDYIRTDNGKITDHFTLYAKASWEHRKWQVELGVSGIGAVHRRWDRYNYTAEEGIWSKNAAGAGFSSKAGVLFRPASGHSIYVNGGVYSRLPYPNVWFSSGNNELTRDVKNEKNYLTELGYRFTADRVGVEVTGYWSLWQNKTLMSNKYQQSSGNDRRFMINGLDAQHYGVELDAFWKPAWWVKLSGFASIGNWTWQNDVTAKIYDEYTGQQIGTTAVYTRGLHVGDAPQTQVGAAAEFRFLKDFRFKLEWNFNDRMYADFDPAGRTDQEDRSESWMLPSRHLMNAHLDWSHQFKGHYLLSIFVEGGNLLNTRYIERGKDGKGHDEASFQGFWGFGRNCSFGARFRF